VKTGVVTFKTWSNNTCVFIIHLVILQAQGDCVQSALRLRDLVFLEEGGFFVGTVTNDPFAETHLTCIGFDDEIVQAIGKCLETVPNLRHASF
jgi:hypothetical protein